MIAVAKAAGCQVGLTTNGTHLDGPVAERLLDLGVDLVAVSVAGARPETHAHIRVGSDLCLLLEHVAGLLARRGRRGASRPKVEFSYLMTPSSLAELPALVETAGQLGVDEVYTTNVDYAPGPEQEAMMAFASAADRDRLRALVSEAEEAARRLGLGFRPYPLEPEEVSVCEGNPLQILFVSSDGWVSPCTYMGLAGRTTIPRRFQGQAASVPRLRFGNVLEDDLMTIWERREYRTFRRQFASRKAGGAVALLMNASRKDEVRRPEAPDACRSCYKLYGL
jgi:MoaA/NifB/PqqE/SkfB family radical SAM enzyme